MEVVIHLVVEESVIPGEGESPMTRLARLPPKAKRSRPR